MPARAPRAARRALALLGTLAALAPSSRAADDARAIEIVQGRCFICHGADGESSTPVFPRLAGQHARYIERQLADYQSGRRKSGTMQPMLDGLDAADFERLGRYFESRPPQAHPVADATLAEAGRRLYQQGDPARGLAACAGCHGPNGAGTEVLPRLAGQHAHYTELQLEAFGQRDRTNDDAVMQAIAARLSEPERKAVAAYLSGLR